MKKIIFFLVFASINLFSQDFEPTQSKFLINSDSVFVSPDSALCYQNKMLLGWHWGGGWKMTQSLKMSQIHGFTIIGGLVDVDTNAIADSLDWIMCTPVVGWHWSKFIPAWSMSMQYEPTLRITNPGSFTIRQYDSTHPVFGFKYIRGKIYTAPGNWDYNRLELSVDSLVGDTVLKEPWMSDQFVYRIIPGQTDSTWYSPDYNSNLDTLRNLDFNGKEMFVSINLRRLDYSRQKDDYNVLAIRLPYVLQNGGTGKIQFQYLPDPDSNAFIYLKYGRGIARNIISANNPDVVYIKRSMLPTFAESTRDITISAKFISDNFYNRYFKPGKENFSGIDSLKIEVQYLGGCDVGIDWIRIECKVAQDLFRGLYDSSLVANAQRALTDLTQQKFKDKGIRPLRFYTVDEVGPPWIWASYRYENKLIGNICTTEINPIYPKLFDYYVNPPNFLPSIGFPTDGVTPGSGIGNFE